MIYDEWSIIDFFGLLTTIAKPTPPNIKIVAIISLKEISSDKNNVPPIAAIIGTES